MDGGDLYGGGPRHAGPGAGADDGLSPSQAFAKIIDVLVENSIQYLLEQLKAGADVLQIFDTWAGVLPPREFERWSVEPTRRIVEGVRAKVPDAKIIGFPRGAGALLPGYVEAPASTPSASTGPPNLR